MFLKNYNNIIAGLVLVPVCFGFLEQALECSLVFGFYFAAFVDDFCCFAGAVDCCQSLVLSWKQSICAMTDQWLVLGGMPHQECFPVLLRQFFH